jgi:hypothetical protein
MNRIDDIKKMFSLIEEQKRKNPGYSYQIDNIKKSYGLIKEEDETPVQQRNIATSIEKKIEADVKPMEDKQQSYRISGNIITIHGKEKSDLELTTDEKKAFQETIDEFITEVSDLVEFQPLNLYSTNVEWGGTILDYDIEFLYSIGETNGIYLNGTMIRIDDELKEFLNKLKAYYDKFKSRWANIIAQRKKAPVKK